MSVPPEDPRQPPRRASGLWIITILVLIAIGLGAWWWGGWWGAAPNRAYGVNGTGPATTGAVANPTPGAPVPTRPTIPANGR